MKKASDKQKYACKLIFSHIENSGNVNEFVDNLTAQEAFLYIKDHEDVYKNLRDKIKAHHREMDRIRANYDHRDMVQHNHRIPIYDNAFSVTDWSDCYDYGICPWGNS